MVSHVVQGVRVSDGKKVYARLMATDPSDAIDKGRACADEPFNWLDEQD